MFLSVVSVGERPAPASLDALAALVGGPPMLHGAAGP
jgi:hypothetical protein